VWLGLAAVVAASTYGVVSARGPLVTTVEVVRGDLEQHLVASGRVWVPSRVQVSAQTAGVVVTVAVDEGDEVQAGDLLVQLDDTELRAGVAQAQAVVAQAEAQVAQLRSVGVVVARARLDQADTSLDRAADALVRARELGAQGAIARVELEEAERVEGVARAQQVTAAAQRRAAAPRGVDSQAAQASLQLAQAALVAVEARLAQRRILAPRQALVLTRAVEPGDMVQPGRVLLVLAAGTEAAQLVFQADERNLALIDVGQPAVASADAYPDRTFASVLSYIAPSIDPARGSVEVRLSIAEVPDYLKPDMTVSVDITVARRSDVLTLDADAVHGAATRTPWIWVVQDGHLRRREVTLGLRGTGSLEIRAGLEPGTPVALPGVVLQSAGQRVRSTAQEL
jgi:HlyD family secretion protein